MPAISDFFLKLIIFLNGHEMQEKLENKIPAIIS